jgi:O-antigen/teichoic acid export membrane protein
MLAAPLPASFPSPGDPATPSMGRRVLAGSLWLFLLKIFKQLVFLGRAIVLARLLTPKDFGLVGMGELAILLIAVFTYTGVEEALVVQDRPSASFVQTAWWLNLGRSTIIALGLFFLAPFLAEKFREPAAISIFRVLALGQFLYGFISVGVTLLYKDMQFRRLCQYEAWAVSLDFLVAVAVAFWWRNVWALVLGTLAGIITRIIASYLIYPGKPRLSFDLQAAKKILGFGRWVLLSGLASFFMVRSTESLSGFLFGAAALGLYQMAARFAFIPVYHFGEAFMATLFPAFSLFQADAEKLRGGFVKGIQTGALIIFPLAMLIAMVLGPLLPHILGPKWQGVVPLVQVLAIGGAVQAILRTGSPLFMATGRPDCQFIMNASSALGVSLLIFPLSRSLGLAGLAWAYSLGIFGGAPVWWRLVRRQSRISSRELIISLTPPLLAAMLMGTVIWLPSHLWSQTVWGLLFLGVISAAGYVSLIILGERYLPDYRPLSSILNLVFPGRQAGQSSKSSP